jgi:hypothetical protein
MTAETAELRTLRYTRCVSVSPREGALLSTC